MKTDQIAVIDIGIIKIFTGINLGLKLFDNIIFPRYFMYNMYAGDVIKGFC